MYNMLPMRRALTPTPGLPLGGAGWHDALAPDMLGRPHHAGSVMVSVQEDALLNVLPGFARRLQSRSYDSDIVIDQLILNCPELFPHTRWNYLEEEEIRRVYHWIIRAESRSSHGEIDILIATGLMEALERSIQSDRTVFAAGNTSFFHRRSQRLFRSLAEVSRQTESLRIGSVLAQWFITHATHIAATDNALALGQWCYAILRATMSEVSRRECLIRVLRSRPDLPARLVGRGQKAEEVVARLEIVSRQLGRRDLELCPRGDDLLLGGGGLDFPEFGIGRARSRDRLLMPRLGGSMGGRRHALGGLGMDGLGGLGGMGMAGLDGLDGGADRLLMAQDAARDRNRMLQLAIPRPYADRLDGAPGLGLDQFIGLDRGLDAVYDDGAIF